MAYAPESANGQRHAVTVACAGGVQVPDPNRIARVVSAVLARRGVTGGARVRVTTANCPHGPMLVQVNLLLGNTATRIQAVCSGLH